MSHWTETFFTEHFKEFGFDARDPEHTEMEARFIAGALDLKEGDRILDLCCGIGRHSLELSAMGYDVLGIDLTKAYIECAQSQSAEENLDCEFIVADMRDIPFQNEFDAAFNFFTSWGYYTDEENLEVLRQVRKALKNGGRFLIEVMNRDWIIREFLPLDVSVIEDKKLIQYRNFDPEKSMLEAEYIYFEGRKIVKHDTVDLRIYSLHEIFDMFRKAGLRPITKWGNNLGRPFDFEKSNRCVVLGEAI
jgi:SAM-dependent methyltransferase